MAYTRIGPIRLAAGGLGIEGPTLIHDGGIPFPSGNVGGGVFSLEGFDITMGFTFLYCENY